ncbi:YopX family protein [Streptococcus salivarius]|uniref:YopX family protein n=1 Tax=Streptococcus salivarius TaxID=1304 RepID=UPI001BD9D3D3|nr:DNA-packaging protein [Streptococcus salivarius]
MVLLRFRAWDKEFKEMVQVDALVFDEQIIKATYKNGNVVKEDIKNYVLMQSTGLRDKNGKEIFEGDIIAIEVEDLEAPVNAKVFCNNDIGVLMFHVFEDNEDVPMVELLEDNSVAFAVIGNIWEDGELLDVENTEEN